MTLAVLSDAELDAVTGGNGPSIIYVNPIHIVQINNQHNVGGRQIAALNSGGVSQSQSQSNTGTNIVVL
jgi:hypothetical protein